MLQLKLHGFMTGLHFALLQLCYLLLLMFNVSSTYLTYALITTAWMAGAIAGLAFRSLDVRLVLLAGVLAYYGALAAVHYDPLAYATLAAAAVGVFLSGLWAGRFFVVMLPRMKRVDSLFFHENNGFVFGIAAAFVAFTLIGRPFLLYAPLVSGACLLVHLNWILRQPA